MTTRSLQDRDRLLELAAAYCDATATADEVAALEARLAGDEAARREFLAYALVHGSLPYAGDERPTAAATGAVDVPLPAARPRQGRLLPVAVAAGTLAAALAVAAWLGGDSRTAATTPLATLTDTRFLVPAAAGAILQAGQPLAAGRFAIRSGAAKLTLKNGVTLVLDGPAEVELVDEMRAILHDGSVVVRVPEGMSGFRLDTTTTEVLDLGTEFAVRAGSGLVTDVQVYEGAVITSRAGADGAAGFPRRVEAGQAVRLAPEAASEPEEIPYVEERFLRALPPAPATGERVQSDAEDLRSFGTPEVGGIRVVRFESPPVIDGRLDEWPEGAAFMARYASDADADTWVEGRMAYDRDRLYVAARVGDPFPLRNQVDPHLDPDMGWRGGGVQLRISTDRLAGWPVAGHHPGYFARRHSPVPPTPAEKAAATNPRLTSLVMWHHAPSGRACLSVAHGMLHAEHEGNPAGYRGAFAVADDGRGYTLEYAIPWDLLNAADDPPRPGDVLAAGWQVHFADASGQIWRRQIVEIRNRAEPYRIRLFERAATWGRAEYE